MPFYEINGQRVELTQREAREMVNRLIFMTRQYVWLSPMFRFDRWYGIWRQHNRAHDINLFLLVMETAGGATLPPSSLANRLKRERDRLNSQLNPRGILQFYDNFGRWQRDSARFCNRMGEYQDRVMDGAARTVRVLEVTRDASFVTLQVCAALLTAGGSTAATAAATSGGAVLARTAATAFIIREMQNSATRLGRAMAGDPPSNEETVDEILESAIVSLQGAALGEFIGRIMGPISDSITGAALREIQRGNIASGVAVEAVNNQLGSIAEDTVTRFLGTNERDVQRLIQQNRQARNNRALGQQLGQGLMQNRAFRRQLEQNIERRAARGR